MANQGPAWILTHHTIANRVYPPVPAVPVVQPGSQWSTVPNGETFKGDGK